MNRSQSGHYRIVNSEEGYRNLTRFLFGALRVDGKLDIDEITLPTEVQREKDASWCGSRRGKLCIEARPSS